MGSWQNALILLAAVWGLQSLGTWKQMRHYREVLGSLTRDCPDGWLGAGQARGSFFVKGVIAILLVAPDGVTRKLLLMEGRSVFAKFEEVPDFAGSPFEALADGSRLEGMDAKRRQAVLKAVDQIKGVQATARAKAAEKPMAELAGA